MSEFADIIRAIRNQASLNPVVSYFLLWRATCISGMVAMRRSPRPVNVCDNLPVAMQRAMLIVDDEEAARYALVRVFEGDYRTVEAASVAQARQHLRANRFDV